jgi:hypothetical protein
MGDVTSFVSRDLTYSLWKIQRPFFHVSWEVKAQSGVVEDKRFKFSVQFTNKAWSKGRNQFNTHRKHSRVFRTTNRFVSTIECHVFEKSEVWFSVRRPVSLNYVFVVFVSPQTNAELLPQKGNTFSEISLSYGGKQEVNSSGMLRGVVW